MAAFSDYTVDQIRAMRAELGKAIATGATLVRFADRQVQYRSLDEMRRTVSLLEEELASRTGGRRLRRLRVGSRKGF